MDAEKRNELLENLTRAEVWFSEHEDSGFYLYNGSDHPSSFGAEMLKLRQIVNANLEKLAFDEGFLSEIENHLNGIDQVDSELGDLCVKINCNWKWWSEDKESKPLDAHRENVVARPDLMPKFEKFVHRHQQTLLEVSRQIRRTRTEIENKKKQEEELKRSIVLASNNEPKNIHESDEQEPLGYLKPHFILKEGYSLGGIMLTFALILDEFVDYKGKKAEHIELFSSFFVNSRNQSISKNTFAQFAAFSPNRVNHINLEEAEKVYKDVNENASLQLDRIRQMYKEVGK